eukprot:Nitzschia sp. Nitz4//scaffold22_size323478//175069//176235//NITZ4_000544-RA/size323478-processed-gene-0.468-mRNA-1//-1//CDS//3329543046//6979//frame0
MARAHRRTSTAKGNQGEKASMKTSKNVAGGIGRYAPRRRHANRDTFPLKMFRLLESQQHTGSICWIRGGTTIAIKDKRQLEKILPEYFGHCRIRSLQRQFSFWGFRRIGSVGDKQADEEWYHPSFIQGNLESVRSIIRSNLKPIPSKMSPKKGRTQQEGTKCAEEDDSCSSGTTTPGEHLVKMDYDTHDLTGPECLNRPQLRITRRVSNTEDHETSRALELELEGSLSDEDSKSLLESFPPLTRHSEDHEHHNTFLQDTTTTTAFPSNDSLGGDQRACAMTLHVFDLRLMDDTSAARSQHPVVLNAVEESDYDMNDPIHHFTELSSSSCQAASSSSTTTYSTHEGVAAANCCESLDRFCSSNVGCNIVGQEDDDDISLDFDMIESVFV